MNLAEPLQKFATNSLEEHWMPFTGNRDFKVHNQCFDKSFRWRHPGHRCFLPSDWLPVRLAARFLAGGAPLPISASRSPSGYCSARTSHLPSVAPACLSRMLDRREGSDWRYGRGSAHYYP